MKRNCVYKVRKYSNELLTKRTSINTQFPSPCALPKAYLLWESTTLTLPCDTQNIATALQPMVRIWSCNSVFCRFMFDRHDRQDSSRNVVPQYFSASPRGLSTDAAALCVEGSTISRYQCNIFIFYRKSLN